jgi:hypothetical protein
MVVWPICGVGPRPAGPVSAANLAAYAGALGWRCCSASPSGGSVPLATGRHDRADRFVGRSRRWCWGAARCCWAPLLHRARSRRPRARANLVGAVGQQDRPNVIFIVIDATGRPPPMCDIRADAPTSRPSPGGDLHAGPPRAPPPGPPSPPSCPRCARPCAGELQARFLSDSFSCSRGAEGLGVRHLAVSSNANVSPTFGYAQGFDEFLV